MAVDRVKIQDVIASQIPAYVRDDFPLLVDFLEEYYTSQENGGGPLDLIQNLDQYVKVDELANIRLETQLGADVGILDTTITLSGTTNFTYDFPDENGLILIDNEIIKYGSKTTTTFEDCVRGFSGVTQYLDNIIPDKLTFQSTLPAAHKSGATVKNLSVLFLQEFFNKLKTLITPGFERRSLSTDLNQKNFVKAADSFYKSKGTDDSFKILFKAIYGEDVEIIKPDNFLIRPSDANYLVSQDYVIEEYVGDPLLIKNHTVYQKSTGSRGTVTKVEKLNVDGNFYQISIDSGYQRDIDVDGTIFGKFEPNSKTKLLNDVSIGSTILDVDSTIDFPSSGTLSLVDTNGEENILSYTDKNLTQFLGVTTTTSNFNSTTDVRKDDFSFVNVGVGTGNQVRFRIVSTLKEIEYVDSNFGIEKGDRISLKTIGISDNTKSDWFYNVKSKLDVKSITLINPGNNIYQLSFFEAHDYRVGYKINITDKHLSRVTEGEITSIDSDTVLNVKVVTVIPVATLSNEFSVENQLLKGDSNKLTSVNDFNANILNVYAKGEKNLIACNSIPRYANEIRCDNKTFTFSGAANFDIITLTTSADHGLYTGDAVYYNHNDITTTIQVDDGTISSTTRSRFTNLPEGVFFVQRVDAFSIRLAESKSNLLNRNYIVPIGTVTDNKFTYYPFYKKPVLGQKIYREIDEPIREAGTFTTKPGSTGILINGVEIENYKSNDVIFYGGIESFDVSSDGKDYDVINPPVLNITDDFGTGATGTISVEGGLQELRIINNGFDYTETPIVKISGGSPTTPAEAHVNMIEVSHSIPFLAGIAYTTTIGGVDLDDDFIGFTTFHNLRDIEHVTYDSNPNPIVGLTTNQTYFSKVIDGRRIRLFPSFDDAVAGINTVQLLGLGNGTQTFSTVERKKIVSTINVSNPGAGYKNREKTVAAVGVSTALDIITIKNHGYETGEIICYFQKTTDIGGLSTNTEYLVGKLDDDRFKLFEKSTGSLGTRYNLDNSICVDLTSEGDGCFNYKPITVSIEGAVGLNTSFGQDIICSVQPIFRGKITNADVTTSGVGYGSSEIFNFNRLPSTTLDSGSGAQLTPIVADGAIKEVVVNRGGSGYNSPPTLDVTGGLYCKLTPVLTNGVITSVIVVNGGVGYRSDSFITVNAAGIDGSVSANINNWTINKFEQNFKNLTSDDCIITVGSLNNSTQLSHLYAPRNLRAAVYGLKSNGEPQYNHPDLKLVNNLEVNNKFHSPIIGWAYDGSPIYGPYGYDTQSGGTVRRMKSGYEAKVTPNRPPLSLYPLGFFVEDYVFTDIGDLNKNNGRFCVTPEYPNGKFVYFATVSELTESSGPFKGIKKPLFPYLIGDSFEHKQNDFNFKLLSNHVSYDLVENGWRRITTAYKINSLFGGYDYIFNSNKEREQIIEVTGTSQGSVDNVGILTGGSNYKVSDKILFSGDTYGRSARAAVSKVGGKPVNNVDISTTLFTDIEFVNVGVENKFVGFMTQPHSLIDGTELRIDGLSDYFAGLDGFYQIGINTGSYILLDDVDTAANTGIVTYFSVGGAFQYPFMRPNDIITISSERVKVLNSDPLNNRVRVLREQDGTTGIAHTGNVPLFQDPKSFSINVGTLKTTKLLRKNTEFYFDPAEALGIGSEAITGAGKTLTFSNPGAGIASIFAPEQQLYLPAHGFRINETVTYNKNGGTSIEIWNGESNEPKRDLDFYSTLFVAPISENFIGLSSTKIGVTTSGYFGIENEIIGLFYFTSTGTGVYHSLKTDFENVVTGSAERTKVVVSTAGTHGLFVDDVIDLQLNPTNEETITVKYNNFNRRIVFDPFEFAASAVNTTTNAIGVSTNRFRTGDKIIYQSPAPSGGLVNEKMYYVYLDTSTSIKLVEDRVELDKVSPNFVNITSAGIGTISKINPVVNATTNLLFDLSDESLSFVSNSIRYPAFKMDIFTDPLYLNQYFNTEEDSDFDVETSGVVGIDGALRIKVKDTPPALYYKFNLENESFILDEKKLVIDTEVISHNTIFKSVSKLDGRHKIVGIGSTTFDFNIRAFSEIVSYDQTTSIPNYQTSSKTAFGDIKKIDLIDNNYGYTQLPGISNIKTDTGAGAILFAESTSIGRITNQKFKSNNIGWNYPTDQTLKPTANLPEIVEIDALSSFSRIGITSSGIDYLTAPSLVVRDGFTDDIVDCVLDYELGDPEVKIITNSTGFFNTPPRIIPVNNSNGYYIGAITLDGNGTTVKLDLTNQFNSDDEYPFYIGGKVYVENINIGIGTTGKGYNSDQYRHNLFSVVGVKTNAGGSGAYVEYTLKDKLGENDVPGNILSFDSSKVIPEEHLPIYTSELRKNKFLTDETVTWGPNVGVIDKFNQSTNILKIKSQVDLLVGDIITGSSSKTKGIVIKRFDFKGDIKAGAGTTINYGWERNTGFLNDELQKIPDNEYYQRFSYSLKSPVPLNVWDKTVGALNHTAGFRKFSDLQVVSESPSTFVRDVEDTQISFTVDCVGSGDIHCYYDFDNAQENIFQVNGKSLSDKVFFENVILTDFFESQGNRAIKIDDVSDSFNSNARPEAFSNVADFSTSVKFAKQLFFVKDTTFTDERMLLVGTTIVDDDLAYLTQYGKLFTVLDLGDVDVGIDSQEWNFEFHPIKFTLNNYSVSSFSFAFEPEAVGAAGSSFGDIVEFSSQEVNVPTGTDTTIVSVGTSFRSNKILNLLVSGDDFHFAELNIIHDDTDVFIVEYNNIDENSGLSFSGGIGTYSGEISGSDVNLIFHPNPGIAATSYSQVVSHVRGTSTTGFTSMTTARVGSSYKSIPSSGSPTEHIISSYETTTAEAYSASYMAICVEDTANNNHEMFELNVLNSTARPVQNLVEYGNVATSVGLGTVGVTTTGNDVHVVYTPNAGIAVEVKTFFVNLREPLADVDLNQIDYNDGFFRTYSGSYQGTLTNIKKSFNLTHNGDQIFERQFDGVTGVNTLSSVVISPNHFFQTGEAVKYEVLGLSSRIGIKPTDFGGSVGVVNQLPTDLFAIKISDQAIGFATSPAAAQSIIPTKIEFDAVGSGTSHYITAINQNTKALITIDNMIQAPITPTNINATLSQDIVFDTRFITSGINTIASNDIIKIDDEFMRVTSFVVGTATTVFVERPILGSLIATHSAGAAVTKFTGNYTITDNTLNFVSAPYGKIPVSSTTNPPDARDFTGITTNSRFSGRVFTKRGVEDSTEETYSKNFVFDDITDQFTGITSEFVMKTGGNDVTGITSNTIYLLNNIYQSQQGIQVGEVGEYINLESAGVTTAQFNPGLGTATGYDPNQGNLPIGGLIVSVGSSAGFGYQPLIGAGGTAVVSGSGAIQSISIGNSGSGYRAGVVTAYTVGVQTYDGVVPIDTHIGEAVIVNGNVDSVTITNPGSGFDQSNPPVVIIEEPLNYDNIPLIYSTSSNTGIGTSATIDIKVGQGSSIIEFEIQHTGYAFKNQEILTVPTGGTTGIPLDPTLSFDEFQITIQDVYSDSFNAFSPGEFEVLDRIDMYFNGLDRVFPLLLNGNPISIVAARDSNIEVDQTLLVFINDILQVPGESYTFEGGSQITFNEAPKGPRSGVPAGDSSRIIFYKGGGDSDVVFRDVLETVKTGDTVQLNANPEVGQTDILQQNKRVVAGITTVDALLTNVYEGPGLAFDKTTTRPVTWCRQTVDKKINGQFVGKDRIKYEPNIFPTSYITSSVGTASTQVYVDSVRPLYDANNETSFRTFQNRITLTSQNEFEGAIAETTVSTAGTITAINIPNPGKGYDFIPTVTIGIETGTQATATAALTGDIVTSVTIDDGGTNYSTEPLVLISEPRIITETINVTSYEGDFGVVTGIGTTTDGSQKQIYFETYIPTESPMRDLSLVGTAVTVSTLDVGDRVVISNTNISLGSTFASTVGTATTFLDAVYEVALAVVEMRTVFNEESVGITTTIKRIVCNVDDYHAGIDDTPQREPSLGNYSWGVIEFAERPDPKSFDFYGDDGVTGISTSGLVNRTQSLKFKNYL